MTRISRAPVLAALLLVALPALAAAADPESRPAEHLLVEVEAQTKAQWKEIVSSGLDVIDTEGMRVEVRMSPAQLGDLQSRGFVTRTLDEDVYRFDDGRHARGGGYLPEYMSYSEVTTALSNFASTYPSITSLSSIGTTLEGRDIWALKISDNAAIDESEPEVLITGNHHAREVITPIINVALADSLLSQYGSNPQYTSWVNDLEIWIVPIINADGVVWVETVDIWWRKTRSFNAGGSRGVDPNRNYDVEWGHDDNGSSPSGSSETYRGPSPASELCVQVMKSFVNSRSFAFALNFHSHGRLLLWGPGWKPGFTEENDVFVGYGDLATAGNGYFPGNTAMGAIYIVNGDSDDWMYAGAGHAPVYAMTPEVGTSFHPSAGQIPGQVVDGLELVWPAFDHAARPTQLAPPGQPTMNALPLDTDGNYAVTWNPPTTADTQPVQYEIVEKTGPSVVTDGLESGTGAFSLGGWSQSSARAANGTFSLYSGQGDELNRIAWANEQYVVQPGDAFTFDAWYSIESNWDYAYALLSTDGGRSFVPLAGTGTTMSDPNGNNADNGITGSSSGWDAMSFDLSAWVGQSVLLGLRYYTDQAVQNEGFYADNLHPVQAWSGVTSLSTTTVPTWIGVAGKSDGTYTYAVRGQDAEGDWGYWSANTSVTVQLDGTDVSPSEAVRSFALSGATPNPFSRGTQIRFSLPAAMDHSLLVFDVAGRRVKTLSSGPLGAGSHTVSWDGNAEDGRPLPSGVYFYSLRAEAGELRSRAVLQR